MVEFVAAIGEVDDQIESLGAFQVNRDGKRCLAAADDGAGVDLAAVDEDVKSDASSAARFVVDGQFRLKAAIGLRQHVRKPRGAVHSQALQVDPAATVEPGAAERFDRYDRAT